ncbi:sugar transferase [Bacteroidales bacterium OttesenSCG-928-B11]|nr:sugar transferase [Bacteroidales bacterium OttesenSCG-928-B11]
MNKRLLTTLYITMDVLAAVAAWVLFFIYRKYNVDHDLFGHFNESVLADPKFLIGLIVYPIYWLFLHTFVGSYNKVYRKSRLKELMVTFMITLIGTLLFFFAFILDDIVNTYNDYIIYYALLFGLQFFLTYIPRLILTTNVVTKIHRGDIGFNTLIIGSDKIALNLYHSLTKQDKTAGNFIIGYVMIPEEDDNSISDELPCLGMLDDLENIVNEHSIEELIIAIQNGKRRHIESIMTTVHGKDIVLKLIPQHEDFLLENIRITSIIHEPLITIRPGYLPDWQRHMKRIIDVFASIIAIILLSPIYLFLAIGVKSSSKGPVFYKQERVGLRGKPFNIIKFRSMYIDAEKGTPQLSSKDDPRITKFGKFMRKSRLDETPQFFNVLLGEMSLVGPRPERQFYIDQIVAKAPYYKLLQGVKPGITSWGQVKYGYAENLDQMIERLRWDILYIENMSLQMDLKILIYTALIVLKRTGK